MSKDCSCSNSSGSQQFKDLQLQANDQNERLSATEALTEFLTKGHPIVMIDEPTVIALFDVETGKGSSFMSAWALCDGRTHPNTTEKRDIATPNLLNMFVIGAGNTYEVGDTGGAAEVTLLTSQIPAHNHAASSPNHSHGITDPGHGHGASDSGHSHGASSTPHNHAVTLTGGDHSHTLRSETGADGPYTTVLKSKLSLVSGGQVGTPTTEGATHTHTGTTDNAGVAVTVASGAANVSVGSNTTGVLVDNTAVSVSVENTGGGQAHNNMPPYYALVYIKKID